MQAETDAGKGNGYAFQIVYPDLQPEWKPLGDAIRQFAAAQKKDFITASTAPDRAAGPDFNLTLTFAVARHTADFVSATASGSSFTGGAHGMPILASFNLDLTSGKIVQLPDLFAAPDAGLQAIAAECQRQLDGRFDAQLRNDPGTMTPAQLAAATQARRVWIDKGTAPIPANFTTFLIDGLDAPAIGIAVIFPPYQVAPYVDGPQQVEVPAKVFYDLLKPGYKAAFAIDTEANKPAQGVR
ncbi:MAG: DUF3298 domain-containing protein [Proteobacteria bacterium]|nr:DUF3298 domain-containing protein [Pseudomonadota bacterium]